MPLPEYTIDLEAVAQDLREKAERKADRREEIKDDAQDVDRDEEAERFESLEEEFAEVTGELEDARGKATAIEESLEEWDGSEFTCRELSFGQVNRIQDEVSSKSFEVKQNGDSERVSGFPREGYYQIQVIQESVQQVPTGASTDPEEMHHLVGEVLFERIDERNTSGEEEMENFSLREELTEQAG